MPICAVASTAAPSAAISGFGFLGPLVPDADASYALPVRRGRHFAYELRFDPRSLPARLAVRLAVPCTRAAEDLHLQVIGRIPPRPNVPHGTRAVPGAPKKAGHWGRPRSPGWRGSHRPRRQIRISPYLGDDDVGCRATGAPTSSRARFEACGSRWARADLGPRHTVDRGASCATPSREVVLCRSGMSRRLAQTHASPGPDGPGRTRFDGGFARFGRSGSGGGRGKSRGNVSPRAASGGPIHARLALGNSAVPALAHAPLRRGPDSCAESPASDAHCSAAGGVPGVGAGSASSRSAAGTLRTTLADLVNERLTRRVAAASARPPARSGGPRACPRRPRRASCRRRRRRSGRAPARRAATVTREQASISTSPPCAARGSRRPAARLMSWPNRTARLRVLNRIASSPRSRMPVRGASTKRPP